ncbi:MAG TPA: MFS transporter [Spirochaetales bacterium]|nr:MFS transporter [Spirochaetales bacterium]
MDTEQRYTLWATSLASFLTSFMTSSLNLALPGIAETFHLSATGLGWIVTSYILATAVCLLPVGKIADQVGRKKIFLQGIGIFLGSSVFCGFAPSKETLLIFRVIQGIGGAMIFSTSVALLTEVFSPQRRGWVLGINTAAVYTGLSLGPVLGGLLTEYGGWRSIFFASLLPGVLTLFFLAHGKEKKGYENTQKSFKNLYKSLDIPGTGLYVLSIVCFMLGFSRIPTLPGFLLTGIGVSLLTWFITFEKERTHPLLNIRLFTTNRIFAFSNLAALINYSSTSAVSYLLSLYLQYIRGFSPRTAGLVLVVQPVLQTIFSPLSGKASDRIEPRFLASAGMALAVGGLTAFACLGGKETSLLLLLFGLSLVGVGFGLFASPNTNSIMSSVDRNEYGVASATLATMRLLGQMLSLGITLMVFFVLMGDERITPATYPLFLKGMRILFSFFAVLNIGGVFASLARGNRDSLN